MNTIQDYVQNTYSKKEINALATHDFTIIADKALKIYSNYHLSIDKLCNDDFQNFLNFVWEDGRLNSTVKRSNHLKVEFTLKKLAREIN